MPSDSPEGVAADHSATVETPASGSEAAVAEEGVDDLNPPTSAAVAEASASWADLSEVTSAPASSSAGPSLIPVKEEQDEVDRYQIDEALKLSKVLATIAYAEEVADDPVATGDTSLPSDIDLTIFDTAEPDNPAEAAFGDIDRSREEAQAESTEAPPAHTEAEVETTDLLDLGGETTAAEASVVEASVASEPNPVVADPSGVATEANTLDSSEIVPPPTSPNLVPPGTEPLRTGHSPAGPSQPSKPRQRSRRGCQNTRKQEALREWWGDFEVFQRWLYENSGGRIVGGHWLQRISYDDADEDQRWLIANFHLLVERFTTSNNLVLAFHIFPNYQSWAQKHGLDRRRGPAHAQQVIDFGDLPPFRIINREILGCENPSVASWDRYNRYVGPYQPAKAKSEAAAPTPVGGAAESGYIGELHPPKAGPKQPDHPPPSASAADDWSNWQPTLRPASHPVRPPKVTTSVRVVPTLNNPETKQLSVSGVPLPPPPKAPAAPKGDTAANKRLLPPPPTTKPPGLPKKPPSVNFPQFPPPRDPPVVATSSSSAGVPPLAPPKLPPPRIPPPPQQPPPTPEELAASEPARVAREDPGEPPEDPDPPGDPDQEGAEEGVAEDLEEEERPEEDEVVEVEAEEETEEIEVEEEGEPVEPEFPDFSPRDRNPKRAHSNPPIPVNLVPRQVRERLEISQNIFRARQEIGLARRPVALRPAVPVYPETRTDPTGTWVRVAGPPIPHHTPNTVPYIVPSNAAAVPFADIDPYQLPDSYWRDPSLRGQHTVLATPNLDPTDIVSVTLDEPDTQSEGEEDPTHFARRILAEDAIATAHEAKRGPVEAGFSERRPPKPPSAPPPKRQRVKFSTIDRTAPAAPAAPVEPAATELPKAASIPPWRQPVGPPPKVSEVAASRATSPRSRTRALSERPASPQRAPPNRPSRGRASNKIDTPPSNPPKRSSTVPVPIRGRSVAAAPVVVPPRPLSTGVPEPAVGPKVSDRGILYKDPPSTPGGTPIRPPSAPPGGVQVRPVPPRPTRPVPRLSAPPPVREFLSKPRPAFVQRAPDDNTDLPPLDPIIQQGGAADASVAAGASSTSSGLAPPLPRDPPPVPTHIPEEFSSRRPAHHGPPLQQPQLVSRVIEINTSNIRVCVDWRDTLDQALNAVGRLNEAVVDRFRALVRAADNRIEFHIVSYAGQERIKATTDSAHNLIGFLRSHGIPFTDFHLAQYPCGKQGKSSIVAALQAHCLIDDRGDILNEAARTGCKTIQSGGKPDKELHWTAAVEDWLNFETVEGILANRRAKPLKPSQFYGNWGNKGEKHRY